MELFAETAAVLALSGTMSVAAYHLRLLTFWGAAASFLTGAAVGIFGCLEWFILLLLFTAAGFAATRMDFLRKKRDGLQEGACGERTHMNVLGVGIVPCMFAVAAYFAGDENEMLMSIGFISSITVAAADTIASEIGVRDGKVWMITTFNEVPAGTDGGVSVLGTAASLAGSFVVAMLGWAVLHQSLNALLVIPSAAGFAGCVLDSVLGATLETKGYISKYTNNASTALIGAVFAIALALPFV